MSPCPGLSSIQITDESGSKVLVNISAAAADSAAAAPGAQQLQLSGNSTQGEQLGSSCRDTSGEMVLIIRPGWAASWFPRKYREIQSNQQHLTMFYANFTTILLFKVWNRPFSTISPRSSGYSCLWTDVLDHADNGERQILILSISTYLVLSSHSNVQCFFRENPEFCFIFWNKLPVYCVECSVNLLIKCWEKWRRITRLSNV